MKREDRFRLLAAMALADGELHSRERERLLGLARLIGIRAAKAEKLIEEVAGTRLKRLKVPSRRVERYGLFQDLVLIAAQDGEIDEAERTLLRKLAPHFGIELPELERLCSASLEALETDPRGAPVPASAGGVSRLLGTVLGLRTGEQRLALVVRLARAEGWAGGAEDPPFARCAQRLKVEPQRAAELVSAWVPSEDEEALAPIPPKEYRDGLRCFGVLVGLNRLRDLVDEEPEFLSLVACRFGMGEVLLRRKLYLYVPASRP
jgi:uncharacterized tellurite resistance protein B-like protein